MTFLNKKHLWLCATGCLFFTWVGVASKLALIKSSGGRVSSYMMVCRSDDQTELSTEQFFEDINREYGESVHCILFRNDPSNYHQVEIIDEDGWGLPRKSVLDSVRRVLLSKGLDIVYDEEVEIGQRKGAIP